MKRSARFAAGAVSVFYIVLVILVTEYSFPMEKALICSALAGAGAGFLYAFLERVFQFAAGFVFGTVLSAWLLPVCFHTKMTSGKGRIWALVIAIAAGVLFALAAKNPLESERILLDYEFRNLDLLIGPHMFDEEALFGYAIKLRLLERLTSFEHEKGKAEFESLFDGIQQRVYSM